MLLAFLCVAEFVVPVCCKNGVQLLCEGDQDLTVVSRD